MISLQKAVLCVDCNNISESNGACPACGSASLLNLAAVLNREKAREIDGLVLGEAISASVQADWVDEIQASDGL